MKKKITTLAAMLALCISTSLGQTTVIPEPTVMDEPAWNGKVITGKRAKTITLKRQRIRQIEPTIDWDGWLEEKGVRKTRYLSGEHPEYAPEEYKGQKVGMWLSFDDCDIIIYGNKYDTDKTFMIIADPTSGEVEHCIDFSKWAYPEKVPVNNRDFVRMEIFNAIVENGILYVGYRHYTYASSSYGQNAYITAIDLSTMEQLWTTKPLTCGSTFVIIGNSIVCGYGFTNEPDFMYVIDKTSGMRRQTLKVPNAPEEVVVKGKQILVRTYSYDITYSYQ